MQRSECLVADDEAALEIGLKATMAGRSHPKTQTQSSYLPWPMESTLPSRCRSLICATPPTHSPEPLTLPPFPSLHHKVPETYHTPSISFTESGFSASIFFFPYVSFKKRSAIFRADSESGIRGGLTDCGCCAEAHNAPSSTPIRIAFFMHFEFTRCHPGEWSAILRLTSICSQGQHCRQLGS
jgi:hypothetical protein